MNETGKPAMDSGYGVKEDGGVVINGIAFDASGNMLGEQEPTVEDEAVENKHVREDESDEVENESDEETQEATPGDDVSPEEENPDENLTGKRFKLKADGEMVEVDLEELKSGYQRQKYFTRRMQEVAEKERQLKAQQEEVERLRQQYQEKQAPQEQKDPNYPLKRWVEESVSGACQRLGIDVDDFDQTDPMHQSMFSLVRDEIKERALQTYQQEMKRRESQEFQSHAQNVLQHGIQEVRGRDQNFEEIYNWAPEYYNNLTVAQAEEFKQNLFSGNAEKVVEAVEGIRKGWYARHKAASKSRTPKKPNFSEPPTRGSAPPQQKPGVTRATVESDSGLLSLLEERGIL